ncbi:MAG: hypothetical protein JM58_16425 [Peptococcaceae bacterium BICA1-8]|nr:MAG: hypothetical protein JM58_16425 [Peptococcaceae bacterium BICA1-8]
MQWLIDKIFQGLSWIIDKISNGLGFAIKDLDGVLIIIAIIGVYFIMAGNKKLGTKITSGSIIVYAILRAVIEGA